VSDLTTGSGQYGEAPGQLAIDLHSHSSFSDGDNNVIEMVRAAEAAQLKVYAVTDHLFGGDRLWKSAAPVQSYLDAVTQRNRPGSLGGCRRHGNGARWRDHS